MDVTITTKTSVKRSVITNAFEGRFPDNLHIGADKLQHFVFILNDKDRPMNRDKDFIFKCLIVIYTLMRASVNCNWFVKKYAAMFVDSPKYYNDQRFMKMLYTAGCTDTIKVIVNRPEFKIDSKMYGFLIYYDINAIPNKVIECLRGVTDVEEHDKIATRVINWIITESSRENFTQFDKLIKLCKKIKNPVLQCEASIAIYKGFT